MKMDKEYRKEIRQLTTRWRKAIREFEVTVDRINAATDRDNARATKLFIKTASKLKKRIAILEGRLS